MPKPLLTTYEHDSLRLRLLEERDLPLTLKWRNQENIRKWFKFSAVIEPEQHSSWFANYIKNDQDVIFIIEETTQLCRPIGQVSLYNIDLSQKRAEFGRLMIGENDARGKGYALKASKMIINIGFSQLGLEEIYLEVFSENHSAIHIYEEIGFIKTQENQNLVFMSLSAKKL